MDKHARPARVVILFALLILACSFLPVPGWLQQRAFPKQPALKVLFIGNSFTFGEDLPALVEQLSSGEAPHIDSFMIAPGGVSLAWHAKNKPTRDILSERAWDFVVLQDCSGCPLHYRDWFESGVTQMVTAVRAAGSHPILYMTWADIHQQHDMDVIAAEYERISKHLDVPLVPVGQAWRIAQEQLPEVNLYSADGHHAGANGALLSAYVFAMHLQKHGKQPLMERFYLDPARFFEFILPRYREYGIEVSQQLKNVAEKTYRRAKIF